MGLAARGPRRRAMALAIVAAVLLTLAIIREGDVVDFRPHQTLLPGLLGFLLPIAVWVGQDRFGTGFMWTLPVERRAHALARVAAGWIWLLAAVALFVLWLFFLSLVSGGTVLAPETLHLVPPDSALGAGELAPGAWRDVSWTPTPLLWLVPFTAATGTYLLASAIALGTRHPIRWVIGVPLVAFVFGVGGEAADIEFLKFAPQRFVIPFILAPYGLDTLLSARTEFLKVGTTLSTGEPAVVWRGLPDVAAWAWSTVLWLGVGAALLWAAASRHRERRRG